MTRSSDSPPLEPKRTQIRSVAPYSAVKHGILSVSPVIPWVESEDDWYDFRDGIFNSLKPEDELQAALTDRAAALLWRLMRSVRHEREAVADNLRTIQRDLMFAAEVTGKEPLEPGSAEHKRAVDSLAMARLVPDEHTLNYLNKYESRLHRHLQQTIRQIAVLKKWTNSSGSTAVDKAGKLPNPARTKYDIN
jgi:hypothetical protein